MTDHEPQFSRVGEQVRKSVIFKQWDRMGMHRVLWNFEEGVREGHQAPLGSRHVKKCFTLAQWVWFFCLFVFLI